MNKNAGQHGSKLEVDFEPRITSILEKISHVADASGVPCFAVGGIVRDTLLQRPVLDLDLLVDTANEAAISAEQFANLASKALGGSHPVCFDRFGTYHFTTGGAQNPLEIEVVGASLKVSDTHRLGDASDVFRRDFTINALLIALNGTNFGRLYDFSGRGLSDLEDCVLRCPLDPAMTLADDPVRALRAVRFHCTLGFTLDDALRDFIRENPSLISDAAVERTRKELELIILSDRPAEGFDMLHDLNLLAMLLPEIEALDGIMQDKRFHSQDVLRHTFSVLSNVEERELSLRLAALFHDVGKRRAKALKGDRIIFYGHEHIGAAIASVRLSALRFPNRLIKDVSTLVRNHMINYSDEWTDAAIRRLIKRLGPLMPRQFDLYEADIRALTDADELLASARELRSRIEAIDEKEQVAKIESPLDGREICALLGIRPGPMVGKCKAKLLDAVLSGEISNDKDAATKYLHQLVQDGAAESLDDGD